MPEPNSSISSFRLFLIRILLPLLFILAGCGCIFSYFFEQAIVFKSQACGAYKVNRILNNTSPGEIPIFGSSRAEGGILPDSLGANYFNYGLSGSKYDVTLFFMEQECKKKKNTPWMLVNLDLDGLQRGLGDVSNYIPNCGDKAVRALLGADYEPWFRIPFIKYYGSFETYARAFMTDGIELTKIHDKGALLEKNALPEEEFDELVRQRRGTATVFGCDTPLIQKLFGLIAAHGERKFVFIVSPYHSSFFDRYLGCDVSTRFMDSLRSYKNVEVYDFSKLPLADSMFLNTSHLNFKGAVVFSRLLRDSLNAAGIR